MRTYQSSNEAINHQRYQQKDMPSYTFDFYQSFGFDPLLRFARAALVELLLIVVRHDEIAIKRLIVSNAALTLSPLFPHIYTQSVEN